MLFKETKLKDAYIIELELIEDNRGFFARSFCREEFRLQGINMNIVQCNISYNKKKGTLRGMHYQAAPYEEAKLVSCIKGAIYDVIIDIRPDSATYCQWIAVELTAHRSQLTAYRLPLTAYCSQLPSHHGMLYIPKGFAHGFITLSDQTEVFYQISEFYSPDHARGVRWNDPAFGIRWPEEVQLISERDNKYPDFEPNR
jgi:dTDP-4-dehydrorhamnose 3,5-epimerase